MSKQQIILRIMEGVRQLGIKPSDFLGKGTNIFRFPKQGEINPFDPNMLSAMKQYGEDSINAAKRKLSEGVRFLTTENENNLMNYLNNLNDFLSIGKGITPTKSGIKTTKEAELFEMGTKKPITGAEKEIMKMTRGIPEEYEPQSLMGEFKTIGGRLQKFLDDMKGISPEERKQMNVNQINSILKKGMEAGGNPEEIRKRVFSRATNLDDAEQDYLGRYLEAKNAGAKTDVDFDLFDEGQDSFYTFSDKPDQLLEHFKRFYTPRNIRANIQDAIEKNLKLSNKFSEEEISDILMYKNFQADKSDPIAYLEEVKNLLKERNFDLDTTVYKNYADTYTYGSEKLMNKIKSIKPKKPIDEVEEFTKSKEDIVQDLVDRKFGKGYFDDDDVPFADGGRVKFSGGGRALQGIINALRSKYGEDAVGYLEEMVQQGKLKMNELKQKFLEDREAVKSFEQREKENVGTLKEFYEDFIAAGGNPDATMDDVKQAYRLKRAYPFNTPFVDKTGKLIGQEATQKMYPESKKFYIEDPDVLAEEITAMREGRIPRTKEGERQGLDIPPVPEGFKLSKEKLMRNFPEIDEDYADEIMKQDKEIQVRLIKMMEDRRRDPELYDELMLKYGNTLKFQGEFDKAVRRKKNAKGGLI